MKIANSFLVFSLILITSACSQIALIEEKSVAVSLASTKIEFQGKGAGAGIALMSTMGPVGIALGVAIDEGIAKEIHESAEKTGFDINALIADQFQSDLSYSVDFQFNDSKIDKNKSVTLPLVTIKKYGFTVVNGSTDATAAEWVIEAQTKNGEMKTFHFPNDYRDQLGETLKTYPLDELKKNGQASVELLKFGLSTVLKDVNWPIK